MKICPGFVMFILGIITRFYAFTELPDNQISVCMSMFERCLADQARRVSLLNSSRVSEKEATP